MSDEPSSPLPDQFGDPILQRRVNRFGCHDNEDDEDGAQGCQLFVSFGSLIWLSSCLGTTTLLVATMFSKSWISSPKQFGLRADGSIDVHVTPYRHTVGPWWVCTNYDLIVVELEECDVILGRLQPDKLPPAWTLSGTLFLMASLLALSGAVSSLCSMCCQNCLCEHKSVFSITGIIYGFVGIFLVGGFVSFALGSSHPSVQSDTFCGRDSFLLLSGKCSISWSFYLSLLTIVLCMSAALFSPLVENSITPLPFPSCACCCEKQEALMPFPTAESLRLFYDAYQPSEANIEIVEKFGFEKNYHNSGHQNKIRMKALSLNDYEFVRVPHPTNHHAPSRDRTDVHIPAGMSGSQTFTSFHLSSCQSNEGSQSQNQSNHKKAASIDHMV